MDGYDLVSNNIFNDNVSICINRSLHGCQDAIYEASGAMLEITCNGCTA